MVIAPIDAFTLVDAVVPFAWGADLDRLLVALTLGGGLGVAVAGVVAPAPGAPAAAPAPATDPYVTSSRTASAASRGSRCDGELVLQTGGVVVLMSFLAVALLWRTAPVRRPGRRAAAARGVTRPGAPACARCCRRSAGAGRYVAGRGCSGPQDPDANPAPRALYVLLWVGSCRRRCCSGRCGGWRTRCGCCAAIVAGGAAAAGHGVAPLPAGCRLLAGGGSLLAFVWLELVAPDGRDAPAVVGRGAARLRRRAGGRRRAVRAGVVRPRRRVRGLLDLTAALRPVRPARRRPPRAAQPVPRARRGAGRSRGWWRSSRSGGAPPCSTASPAGPAGLAGPAGAGAADTARRWRATVRGGRRAVPAGDRPAGRRAGQHADPDRGRLHARPLRHAAAGRGAARARPARRRRRRSGRSPRCRRPGRGRRRSRSARCSSGTWWRCVAAHDRSVALLPVERRLADQVPLVLLMVAYTMAGLFLLVVA